MAFYNWSYGEGVSKEVIITIAVGVVVFVIVIVSFDHYYSLIQSNVQIQVYFVRSDFFVLALRSLDNTNRNISLPHLHEINTDLSQLFLAREINVDFSFPWIIKTSSNFLTDIAKA